VAQLVVNGAVIKCAFAMPPGIGTLTVLPARRVNGSSQPAATIMDSAPMVNVASFGACMSPTNPQVAAATAAALGVLTPQPCIPVIPAPWAPGSPTVMIGGQPALTNTCQCMCQWGGVITVVSPGQVTVNSA
jgi:uncharacterized protein DUF4280